MFRCLGSSRSRIQSPNKFKESTTSRIATPGKKDTHQAETTNSRPSATISPQAGVGRGMPAPKKLRLDSSRMTKPTCKVASTTMLFTTLGKIWRIMIRKWDAPATSDRAIKSCVLTARTSPRTCRAYRDHRITTITKITAPKLCPGRLLSPAPARWLVWRGQYPPRA